MTALDWGRVRAVAEAAQGLSGAELASFLERHPEALIQGKEGP